MQKRYVEKLEFYITNVCNLACPDCNRFNDHNFTGHQLWHDYEADYKKWSTTLDVSSLVILGGEPLLNPTICEWVRGLNRCFGKNVQVLTNGTRLNHAKGLYDALVEFEVDEEPRNWVGISVHNVNDFDRYVKEAMEFLRGAKTIYHGPDAKDTNGANVSNGADVTIVDENSVSVRLWLQDVFATPSIHRAPPAYINGRLEPGPLTLFDNDPREAHANCSFVAYKNYHMIRGRLSKCGPCVLMAEFDKQNPLAISESDRLILNSYRALSAWDDEVIMDDFFSKLDQPIAQCKFCPKWDDTKNQQIFAKLKKKDSTGTFG